MITVAWVTAVVHIQSMTWELPHATRTAIYLSIYVGVWGGGYLRKFQKAKPEFAGNYLQNIYIALDIISNVDMI